MRNMANDALLLTREHNRRRRGTRPGKSSPSRDLLTALGIAILALAGFSDGIVAQTSERSSQQQVEEMTKIRMTIEGTEVTATLADNTTAREFISLLPMSLTLEDYNKTEKVSDLPQRLSIEGAPEGFDPSAGDIAYYAPWGNLAVFYRDFGYSRGLVQLGRIEVGREILEQHGPLTVTIERVE